MTTGPQEMKIRTATRLSCKPCFSAVASLRPPALFISNLTDFISGLGIGTTPAALVTHGIDTTVVEIDPVVYELAIQHFRLPRNFTPQIRDAKEYVEEARRNGTRFDYIVHDVFTGGVEPMDLFTLEFMRGVYDILSDDGVISIVSARCDVSTREKTYVQTDVSTNNRTTRETCHFRWQDRCSARSNPCFRRAGYFASPRAS